MDVTTIMLALLGLISVLIALNTVAWAAAWLQQRHLHQEALAAKRKAHPSYLSQKTKIELEAAAKQEFAQAIRSSRSQFTKQLTATSRKLSGDLQRMTKQVVNQEVAGYEQLLVEERQAVVKTIRDVQAATAKEATIGRRDVQRQLEREKAELIKRLDARFADVLGSYLVDSLGEQVDLGAQQPFLLKTLAENRERLRKDLDEL